jgi:hypothetical protein
MHKTGRKIPLLGFLHRKKHIYKINSINFLRILLQFYPNVEN